MIDAAKEVDHAVISPTSEVAAAVEPAPRWPKRIGRKRRRREIGPMQIAATNLDAANATCSAAPSRRRDERLARLKTDEDLIGELVRLNGTPPELFKSKELLRLALDTLAADFAVCSSFSFKKREKLSLDIVVLGGRDDMIEEDALSAWREETLGQTALLMFAGGHFFFNENENVFFARLISELDRTSRASCRCDCVSR
ncbi:thioesterase II family protein [Methylocystis iwaonis]|nr:thioesterase domain-containing protein [Methylocystis iwaonis]